MSSTELMTAIAGIGDAFTQYKAITDKRFQELQDRIEMDEAARSRPRASTSPEHSEHKARFLDWIRRPEDVRVKARLSEAQHELSTKDVSIGTPAAGGFALPHEIATQIEHRVRQLNPFRSLVDVVQCSSNDFNYLVSMGDGTSGWSSETGSRSATNSPTLRNVAPTFGELYALPTASNWSLEDLFFDVEQWLVDDIAADWAAAEATAIISGTGSNQPTGILHNAPTSADDNASPMRAQDVIQYVPLTSPASPLTATPLIDSLIDLVSTVREGYLAEADRCAFVMNRITVAKLRKLKAASAGTYLWEEPQNGNPATLLGYRVFTCDAMPGATALNNLPVIFGNWRRGYLLADRGSMQITLDPYSTPGKTRFYARRRVGGRVKNNDALKALKIAAS